MLKSLFVMRSFNPVCSAAHSALLCCEICVQEKWLFCLYSCPTLESTWILMLQGPFMFIFGVLFCCICDKYFEEKKYFVAATVTKPAVYHFAVCII